ncbi:hypothetical protein ACHAXR_008049 [Thalassiosira sp. AJA248-18]
MLGISSIISALLFAFTTRSSGSLNNIKMTNDISCQKDDVISKLRSLGMGKKELPHHADLRRASILVPLFERDDDDSNIIHVLFTLRPKTMKSHGGEVCFPGGKQDPDDVDDIHTALREAHEEVGLHSQYIESIARMETVESKHSLCVTPIIGFVNPSSVAEPSQLKLHTDEVEAAFAVPLHFFADPDNCHSIEKVQWRGGDFLLRTYLYDDPSSKRQFKIWGLTAHVVHLVATKAFCK